MAPTSLARLSIVAAPLYREELGAHLRDLRHRRGERLADTASRAGVSTQYLSEIERGRKDPSSEIVEAVSVALGTTVGDVAIAVGHRLRDLARAPGTSLRARAFALAA
ncbi:helix-turn-helix domain-containing protein [Gordonia hydrophobica]|uniref:Helix-turn-helix transcriptional regulator n=1 Tax=Gordonia hydrophobica TaxID=40516 RepID=A0ABZ2U3M2_9ACTN|nr:helix-turn-helix transcriptional regulator [Gordonia hydrophobica]MBM7367904.1 transcriptional regulator with XRE-family HTH domain [Gordonia hydrophobica]